MIKKSPVSNKEIHNDSISSTEEQIDIKQLIQSSTKNKRALYSSIGRYHQKIDLSYIKKKTLNLVVIQLLIAKVFQLTFLFILY